jgi:putative flippase GtrA
MSQKDNQYQTVEYCVNVFKKKFNHDTIRYLIVGIFVYLVDLCTYLILLYLLGAGISFANWSGKTLGGVVGFFAHRSFTFRAQTGDTTKQAIRYFIILILYAPFSSLVLKVILFFLSNAVVAKFLSDAFCIVLSYIFSKFLIFKKDHSNGNNI